MKISEFSQSEISNLTDQQLAVSPLAQHFPLFLMDLSPQTELEAVRWRQERPHAYPTLVLFICIQDLMSC